MSGWRWRREAEQLRTDDCGVVGTRLLHMYLDGEAGPGIMRFMSLHVAACRRCREDLASYWKIKKTSLRCEGPDEAAVERLRAFAESLLHSGEGAADTAPETRGAG